MGTKIPQLPFAATLDGTEVFEAVQGSSDVKVSAQQLVALAADAANVADAIGITDTGAYFTATDVEGALQELAARPISGEGTLRTDLSSNDPLKGAALVTALTPSGVVRSLDKKLFDTVSIVDRGAVGDGVTGVSAILSQAVTDGVKSLTVPAGTFLVDLDVDLGDLELVLARGATLSVAVGKSLTVKHVTAGKYPIFAGTGVVKFSSAMVEAPVEWFGADPTGATDAVPAIHKARDACAAVSGVAATVLFSAKYGLGQQLTLTTPTRYKSMAAAEFNPVGGFANGPIIGGGNHRGQLVLPTIQSFTGFCLKLRGTNASNIYCPLLNATGDALVMEGDSTTDGTLLDNTVVIEQIGNVARAIVFKADASSCVMQGNEVRVNFVNNYSVAVVDFESPATSSPAWDSNKVVLQATDQLPNTGAAVVLRNTESYAIPRFTFRVDSWCGGIAAGGKFVSGQFNHLNLFINPAQTPGDLQIQCRGTNNRLDFNLTHGSSNGAIAASMTANNKVGFNGGVPLHTRRSKLQATLTANVAANATVNVFVYHQCADVFSNPFMVTASHAGAMYGMVPDKVVDNSNSVDDEIIITFRNCSGATVNVDTVISFDLVQLV
jgi:hypothetical protein